MGTLAEHAPRDATASYGSQYSLNGPNAHYKARRSEGEYATNGGSRDHVRSEGQLTFSAAYRHRNSNLELVLSLESLAFRTTSARATPSMSLIVPKWTMFRSMSSAVTET